MYQVKHTEGKKKKEYTETRPEGSCIYTWFQDTNNIMQLKQHSSQGTYLTLCKFLSA